MAPRSFHGIEVDGLDAASPVDTPEALRVFEILKPKASTTPLIRIGGDFDGSYLVPDTLDGITACFSPGVNRIKYFEDALTEGYGIHSHMCDFTCNVDQFKTPLNPEKQTFRKKWLDIDPGPDNISLTNWIADVDPPGDLLLQMDIEGAEFRNILATSDEILRRFRIIVLEVHGLRNMMDGPVLREVIAPFFEKLSQFFTSVHAHPNNCCGEFTIPHTDVNIPNVLELTLIRKDWFSPSDAPPQLPHPLDVSRNVKEKPPLFLGEAWCDHRRPLESRVKMLEDTINCRDSLGTSADAEFPSVMSLTMKSIQTATRLSISPDPATPRDLIDVARGRPYQLSSAYGSTNKSGRVKSHNRYFFHTDFGPNQFIRVDLGEPYRISRIEVSNRRDGHQSRARFIFVMISNGNEDEQVFPLYADGDLPGGAWQECELNLPGVTATTVAVINPLNTALHLSELRVYAPSRNHPRAAAPLPAILRRTRAYASAARQRVPKVLQAQAGKLPRLNAATRREFRRAAPE